MEEVMGMEHTMEMATEMATEVIMGEVMDMDITI